MGLGTPLFGGLLRSNAVVTIRQASVNPSGGSVPSWSTLKTGVDVLVSQIQSERDTRNGVMMERIQCSVAGKDPLLSRADVQFLVTAAVPGLLNLVGMYLSATSPGTNHSRGVGGILKERVNVRCQTVDVPADDGGEL